MSHGEKRSKVARAHRNLKPARDGECYFVADVAAKTSLLLPPQTGAARAGAESAGSSSLGLQRLDCCLGSSRSRSGSPGLTRVAVRDSSVFVNALTT